MKFHRAAALPALKEANTFYMISNGAELLEIHVTNEDNSQCRRIPLESDLAVQTVAFSTTAPALDGKESFWWETSTGILFVKFDNAGSPVWVEAVPSVSLPDFAGNGTAVTMSRSDHWHEGVMVHGTW